MNGSPLLILSKDGNVLREVILEDGETVVGRAPECGLRIDDRAVSRQHFSVIKREDGVQVSLKSEFAPLRINGLEVKQTLLKHGDVIELGQYQLRYETPMEAGSNADIVEVLNTGEVPAPPGPMDAGELPQSAHLGLDMQGDEEPQEASTSAATQIEEPASREPPQEGEPLLSLDEDEPSEDFFPQKSVSAPLTDLEVPEKSEIILEHSRDSERSSEMHREPVGQTPQSQVTTDGPNFSLASGEIPASPSSPNTEEALPELRPTQEILRPLESGPPPPLDNVPDLSPVPSLTKTSVVSASKFDVRLVFAPGVANVTEFLLDSTHKPEISIGRSKSCDVVLNAAKASRKHAVIQRAGMNFILRDLGSANGTYVNGLRIQEHELAGGDVIKISDAEFSFQANSVEYGMKQSQFIPVRDEISQKFQRTQLMGAKIGAIGSFNSPGSLPGISPDLLMQQPTVGMGVPFPGGGQRKGKNNLLEKYRALPKRKRILYLLVVIAILVNLFDETPPIVQNSGGRNPAVQGPGNKELRTFETLSPEQQKFVDSQYRLAFELYRNKEFDQALFQLGKIFQLVANYKDARELEKYAQEGKRRLETADEDRRNKEEEARIKARVEELLSEGKDLMGRKQYDDAGQVFLQILALDPENQEVAKWQNQLAELAEKEKMAEVEKNARAQINQGALAVLNDGLALSRAGKCSPAMNKFRKVLDMGASDAINAKAKKGLASCLASLKEKTDPLYEQAVQLEGAGDIVGASKLYRSILALDPSHKGAKSSMAKIRGVLHERAKSAYTEAVLAESYSDFDTARKKYEECLSLVSSGDVYYHRAKRKLAKYETFKNTVIQ